MTNKEILEYNKRCAKFLTINEDTENELQAYPEQQYSPLCSYANAAYSFDKKDNSTTTVWDYCKFHSDWNWIHEVIDAIEITNRLHDKEYYPYLVQIWKNCCSISDGNNGNEIIRIYSKTKQEAVIQAINQFLIWYEQQKK